MNVTVTALHPDDAIPRARRARRTRRCATAGARRHAEQQGVHVRRADEVGLLGGLPVGLDAAVHSTGEMEPVAHSRLDPELGLVLSPRVHVAEGTARRCVDLRGERVISTDAEGSERKGRAAGAELCRAERRLDGDLVAPGNDREDRSVAVIQRAEAEARDVEQIDVILGAAARWLEPREPALNPDLALPRTSLRLHAGRREQRQTHYNDESLHGKPSLFLCWTSGPPKTAENWLGTLGGAAPNFGVSSNKSMA